MRCMPFRVFTNRCEGYTHILRRRKVIIVVHGLEVMFVVKNAGVPLCIGRDGDMGQRVKLVICVRA